MKTFVTFFSLFFVLGTTSGQTTRFSYKLASRATTSAGIKDNTGALIRTLWSARSEAAGPHTAVWDGNKDDGTAAAPGTYTRTVLVNNVRYQWDGLIGGTEDAWLNTHNQWDLLGYNTNQMRLTFVGTTAIVAPGYSEGSSNLFTFDTSRPNTPQVINAAYRTQNVQFADADNDGSFLYLANAQVWSGKNFVTKFTTAGVPAAFTTGKAITGTFSWSGIPMNGINVYSDKANVPVAIAVQNSGNILAVSYSGKSGTAPAIIFYDKTSGSTIGTPVTLTVQATSMGFTSAGLWYVSNGNLYLLASPSTSSTATQPIAGFSNVIFVSTNKATNNVVVMDGGTHQQVFEYNSSNTLTRTFGVAGGYTTNGYDPTITNTKLLLDGTATKGTTGSYGSWVRVDNSDGLWICDGGNNGRILHINSSNAYVDKILFSISRYALTISAPTPNRVFQYSIEYDVDYTKPLLPGDPSAAGGNGAWTMAKNWAIGAEGANGSPSAVTINGYAAKTGLIPSATGNGIESVVTLSNNRTYAIFYNNPGNYEVELPATGPARYTGNSYTVNTPLFQMMADGSWEQTTVSTTGSSSTVTLSQRALTGFDASGKPVRNPSYTNIASTTYNNTTQANADAGGWRDFTSFQATTNGTLPMFTVEPKGTVGFPHLGGFLQGRSTPSFEAYPEAVLTHASFKGQFPNTAGYGGHSAQLAQAIGTSIFTAYDGQYALWGQTYCQWYQDGLLVGCYGMQGLSTAAGYGFPDRSGNIGDERWGAVGSDLYMYHTSESALTPIHRWHISNLSSIHELTGRGAVSDAVAVQ